MKVLKILIAIFYSLASLMGSSQSLATNILFDQSTLVYKGRVEDITYAGSNGEGNNYTIFTIVDTTYKNSFYNKGIAFTISKNYVYDLIGDSIISDNSFHLKKDSSYIFFIRSPRMSKGSDFYFADLSNKYIEGIPYSVSLEHELAGWYKFIYPDPNGTSSAVNTLLQSSPISLEGEVLKIIPSIGLYQYKLKVKSPSQKDFEVMVKDLTCLCAEGAIGLNKRYLFFLTPFDKNQYVLTDQWLGVMEFNQNVKYLLKH